MDCSRLSALVSIVSSKVYSTAEQSVTRPESKVFDVVISPFTCGMEAIHTLIKQQMG